MTSGQGRAVVEDMLRRGHLERVPANRNESTHLLTTREGGHEAAISAVEAQMDPPMGETLRPYRRLRRRRGQGDYYGAAEQVHPDDVALDLPAAAAIVDMAETLCSSEVLTVFTPEIR